ncbi:hypothetical protein ANRL3_00118 [Anaerolineae bacterium]|nr:hypothetical protein ANRL3_00118 [Anaerolineae bacterium]
MLKKGSTSLSKKLFILTLGGGVVFWVTTIAISLLPIAAEYRSAFSKASIQTVWVASLPAGLIIGCCVSYSLLRFFDKIPTKDPILKSVIISLIVLVIITILNLVPHSYLGQRDVMQYFFIGIMLDAPRFLFLGIVIGYLYRRLFKGSDPSANASKSAQAE